MNLLYNALIKPILEYRCPVWGNTKIDNLRRLLRIKKRCARIILSTGTERTVDLFKRLGWIPISDRIEQRKLCIMYNIIHGNFPDYFNHYIRYVKNRHHYTHTHTQKTNMDLSTPFFETMTSIHIHFLQVALDYRTTRTVLQGVSLPLVNLEINYTRNI